MYINMFLAMGNVQGLPELYINILAVPSSLVVTQEIFNKLKLKIVLYFIHSQQKTDITADINYIEIISTVGSVKGDTKNLVDESAELPGKYQD